MPNNNAFKTSKLRPPFAALATTLLMLIALALSAGLTQAQPLYASRQDKVGVNGIRASYAPCLAAAAGVTTEMKQCMSSEYAYQDKRLNKAYRILMATSDKGQRTKLRSDERAWIAYRNAHCSLDPNGGQAAELDAYDCSVQETAKQANALEVRLRKTH